MFVKGDRITHFINIRQLPSVMNHSMTGMNSEEYKRKKKPTQNTYALEVGVYCIRSRCDFFDGFQSEGFKAYGVI